MVADRNPLAQLLELRAANWSRSPGCPTSTICSSFDFSVSRFDSIRNSSSAAETQILRLVDDQQDQPTLRGHRRGTAQGREGGAVCCVRRSSPKSIMIVSRSSRGSSIVFTMRPSASGESRPRTSVCSSVVLPDPISPVITTKPAWLSTRSASNRAPRDGPGSVVQIVRIGTERERPLTQLVKTFVNITGLRPPLCRAMRRAAAERAPYRRPKSFRMVTTCRRDAPTERHPDRASPSSRARSVRNCRSRSGPPGGR